MKPNRLLLLTVAAFVMPFSSQTFAAPRITFEVVATFDYPDAMNTYAQGINDDNVVAGFFTNRDRNQGFVRFGDHFSAPIVEPDDVGDFTRVTGINNTGTLCGFYVGPRSDFYGFLLSGSTYTTIDLADHHTNLNGINDVDNLCGSLDAENPAFVTIDGTTTTFTIPGANAIEAEDINNLNQSVGYYRIGLGFYGFFRDPDGALTYPIMASDTSATFLFGINDKRWMVGGANDETGGHAVLFLSPNKHVTYDYPGADSTSFYGINSQGVICGSYTDAAGSHGLIVRAKRAADE